MSRTKLHERARQDIEIDGDSITVDERRMIKCSVPLYLDQGIAVTVTDQFKTVTSHASQGKTVDQVIVSVFRIWKPGNPQAFI
jgi:hypothetical protein